MEKRTGETHFESVVALWFHYNHCYFDGTMDFSNAIVVIINHDLWVSDPRAVVDALQVLGLPRNNVVLKIGRLTLLKMANL